MQPTLVLAGGTASGADARIQVATLTSATQHQGLPDACRSSAHTCACMLVCTFVYEGSARSVLHDAVR